MLEVRTRETCEKVLSRKTCSGSGCQPQMAKAYPALGYSSQEMNCRQGLLASHQFTRKLTFGGPCKRKMAFQEPLSVPSQLVGGYLLLWFMASLCCRNMLAAGGKRVSSYQNCLPVPKFPCLFGSAPRHLQVCFGELLSSLDCYRSHNYQLPSCEHFSKPHD